MNYRNIDVLEHMASYCEEIDQAIQYFGKDIEIFKANKIYRNAVSMCVLQIGELVGHLTDDFRAEHKAIPWKNMRSMRNIAVHQYLEFDLDTLWETILEDTPVLRAYCEEILSQYPDTEEDD